MLLSEAEALAADLGLTLGQLEARTVAAGFTGSGGRPVAALLGGVHINELVAQTCAIGRFYPAVRTVIEIGGQDSKFLSTDWDETLGRMVLSDMAMNNLCAAGTGAFLDQQAERLGIAIEGEFAEIALRSENPARIAGRCTVFATSDMVHLQQIGTPMPDILAGLCMALARNFRTVIGKAKVFRPPIAIQGGVAYNRAVVRAFEETLKLAPGELLVPENHHVMAAIGAALDAQEKAARTPQRSFAGFDVLAAALTTSEYQRSENPALPTINIGFAQPGILYRNGDGPTGDKSSGARKPIYLGVDVGSVTTKVVALDEKGHLLARRYVRTQGRPLDVVRDCLGEVGDELAAYLGDHFEVVAVGATGSGRHLTADFIGADVVRSEITAQARAATAFDPAVDTVFEIGGQDSKYIRIQNGVVVDFTMNSACAAGTGAFIEQQAGRLQVDVEEEFSALALEAACPVQLGERCTVFMESDLVHHQQQGAGVGDLSAGLAYAIVENYLNRVVGTRALGSQVLFLGGVAWNDSVVSAFHARTGRQIAVPPHHDVSGAIGAALLARDELHATPGAALTSSFRGFDLTERPYLSRSFICQACPNLCEINKVTIGSEPPVFHGARCDMYDAERDHRRAAAQPLPDLFAEREALLMEGYVAPGPRVQGRPRVGLPRTLYFWDMFPYWRAFFARLGMDVVLSDATNPTVARLAKEHAVAETCYPVKLVHGHVAQLIERDVDFIFLPNLTGRDTGTNALGAESVGGGAGQPQVAANCPYIRASGDLTVAAMKPEERGTRVLTPALHMQWARALEGDLKQLAHELRVSARAVRAAHAAGQAAQAEFAARIAQRGAAALAALEPGRPAVVLVGRPYNTADMGVCQSLPHTLRKLGVLPIPMDYLPLQISEPADGFAHMYWRSGQEILGAARLIRRDERLHALYVSSFGCGPDSFVINYFRRLMAGKPFLELELDDHTADAGVVTRCEAFIESLQGAQSLDAAHTLQGVEAVYAN